MSTCNARRSTISKHDHCQPSRKSQSNANEEYQSCSRHHAIKKESEKWSVYYHRRWSLTQSTEWSSECCSISNGEQKWYRERAAGVIKRIPIHRQSVTCLQQAT